MGTKVDVTRSVRCYTALMLLGVGMLVAVVLWFFEMSTALVVSVLLAFVVAGGMALVMRRPTASSDRQSVPPASP